jgi:uncharacterized repeat protein (TIGR03803 family)
LSASGIDYSQIYSFDYSIKDGLYPEGKLCQAAGGVLYGTTRNGGTSGSGTVFRLRNDGNGYAVIHNFGVDARDGVEPSGGLVQGNDGWLFGVTRLGGVNSVGTVFKFAPNGEEFTVLHHFKADGIDGHSPNAGLVQGNDGALYGTTEGGGEFGNSGTVFRLNTDGTGYTVLWSFKGNELGGRRPLARLLQGIDGAFYGTTYEGGEMDLGTVFRFFKNTLPLLRITQSQESFFKLTWPGELPGFQIELAKSLSPPIQWSAITNQSLLINGQFSVTLPVTTTNAFYRLIKTVGN